MSTPYFAAKKLIEDFDKTGSICGPLMDELRKAVDEETNWRKGPGMAPSTVPPKPKTIDEQINDVDAAYKAGRLGAQAAFTKICDLAKRAASGAKY